MIVGDTRRFAIEFEILTVYPDQHFLALGLFVVHVSGKAYGVQEPDATTFGNAVNAVETLIGRPIEAANLTLSQMPAHNLADLYLDSFYRDRPNASSENELEQNQRLFLSPPCLWPNSDEEFDDGSHILLFGLQDRIRVVAFRNHDCHVADLAEELLEPEAFRETLDSWLIAFNTHRQRALQPTEEG